MRGAGEPQVEETGVGRAVAADGVGVVAVPVAHLVEEADQVARLDDLLARVVEVGVGALHEQAGREDRHEAGELGQDADARRLVLGAEQAGVGERREVEIAPGLGVGGHDDQGRRRGGIVEDLLPQFRRPRELIVDVLLRRHGRGRGLDVEVEGHGLELVHAKLLEVLGVLLEEPPQLGEDVAGEGEAGEAAVDEVVGEAGGHELAVEVDDRIEVGPRHVGDVGLAREVGAEDEQRAGDDVLVGIREAGDAKLEVDVGGVDVGEAVDAEAVPADLAECEQRRPAEAHRHVVGQRVLDQVAVGHSCHGAVGVGDLHVVEAVGRVGEVEDGADAGGVEHLVVDGLELGEERADELGDGREVELRAADVEGHVAAVAARLAAQVGDAEGQEPCLEGDGVVGGAREAAGEDVVVALVGVGHDGGLVGPQVALVGGVVVDRAGQALVADVELVGRGLRLAGEGDLEGLVGGSPDAVEQLLARRQVVGRWDLEEQGLDADLEGVGRGAGVVGVLRPLVDVVVDVGPHDDAVGVGHRGGQRHVDELGRIGVVLAGGVGSLEELRPKLEVALLDAADEAVAEVPHRVVREVDGVGPDARDVLGAVVRDRPLDGHGVAAVGIAGHDDGVDLEVRGRGPLDDHGRGAGRGVVALVGTLVDVAPWARSVGHVGEDEHVVPAEDAPRQGPSAVHRVGAAGEEGALVADAADVVVAPHVEIGVARQVDVVGPHVLAVGHVAGALVGDGVADVDPAAGDGVGRHDDVLWGDPEVGRVDEGHRQRRGRDVVVLVAELVDVAHGIAGKLEPRLAARGGIGQCAVGLVGVGRIDVDEDVEAAVDVIGQPHLGLEGGGVDLVEAAGRHGAVVAVGGHEQVVGVERLVLRDVDLVVPRADAGLAGALVGHGPADGQKGARVGRAVDDQLGDGQVGLAVGHVERLGGRVVGLAAVLPHPLGVERRPVGELARPHVVDPAPGGLVLGVAVGEDVDVLASLDARLEPQGRHALVAAADGEGLVGPVGHRADVGRPLVDELGVGRHVDVVIPVGRVLPHGAVAHVGHGPTDLDGLARECLGGQRDARDLEVGRILGDDARLRLLVVLRERAFEDAPPLFLRADQDVDDVVAAEVLEVLMRCLGERLAELRLGAVDDGLHLGQQPTLEGQELPGVDVGLDDEVRPLGRRREGEGDLLGVAAARLERLVVGHAEDQMLGALAVVEVGVGRDVDGVAPVVEVGHVGAVVGHGPGDGDLLAALGRGGGIDVHHLEVGRRGVEHGEGGGLEVAALEVVGCIGVDVDVEGLLVDAIVGVGPHGDGVVAADVRGEADGGLVDVPVADLEGAGVAEGAELHVAAPRVGAVLRQGEPHRVGPRGGIGDSRAEVGDLVVDDDLAVVEGVGRPDHLGDDEIGRWHGDRVDGDGLDAIVVALVGILVDGVAAVGPHDDVEVARAAEGDLEVVARGVRLGLAQGAAVVEIAQQLVARVPQMVEGQVDAVEPPRAAGRRRHLPEVGHGELDVDDAAAGDRVGDVEGRHLEVGPLLEGDGDARGGPAKIVLVGLDDLLADVGFDIELVDALKMERQGEVLGAGVAHPGGEALGVGEAAELDGVGHLAVGRQVDHVGPRARDRLRPVVDDLPRDVEAVAVIGRRRPLDAAEDDLEVHLRRRHEGHGHRVGARGVVVVVDELVGLRPRAQPRGDEDVVGAARVVGQGGLNAAGVDVADAQRPDVAERLEVDAARRARRVERHPHLVGPLDLVGDAEALVRGRPGDREGLSVGARRVGGDGVDLEIGVGDGGHVDGMGGAGPVGLDVVVLIDVACGVGLHEEGEAALHRRRKLDDPCLGILGARGHQADVLELGDDLVVGVPQHPVARQHDAVDPRVDPPGAVARVAHTPRDREVDGIADDKGLRRDVVDQQVGIVEEADGELRRCLEVVAFARGLLDRVAAVGLDHDGVVARLAVGQRDDELAGIRALGGQRARVLELAELLVPAREVGAVRQVDAVGPPAGRLARAVILARPLHRDAVARLRAGLDDVDRLDSQVGVEEGERRVVGDGVVGLAVALEDLAVGVGDDGEIVRAVGPHRQRHGLGPRVGPEAAGIAEGAQQVSAREVAVAGQRQVDAVAPGGDGRRPAGVGHGPAHLYGLAGVGRGRPRDVGHLEVGHRRLGHGDAGEAASEVVVVLVELLELVPAVREHEHPVLALGETLGQDDAVDLGVVVARVERARVGEAAELDVGAPLVVEGEEDPVAPGRGAGRGGAVVGDAPGHVDGLGGARGGRNGDGVDLEVGRRLRVGHLYGRRVEVVALVALLDLSVDVELDEDVVGALVAPGDLSCDLERRGGLPRGDHRVDRGVAEPVVAPVAEVLVLRQHDPRRPRGTGICSTGIRHREAHRQGIALAHRRRHRLGIELQVGQGQGEVEGVGVGRLAEHPVAVLIHRVADQVGDLRPHGEAVGARRVLRREADAVVGGVDAVDAADGDRAVRPRQRHVGGGEGAGDHRFTELDDDLGEDLLDGPARRVPDDGGAGAVDGEAAAVLVLAHLAVVPVEVLVHRHAAQVGDVGAEGEQVCARGRLGQEVDAEAIAGERLDLGRADGAARPRDRHVGRREAAGENGLAEGHVEPRHRRRDRRSGRVADHVWPHAVHRDGERIAVLGLALEEVAVLIHQAAARVGDVRPDEHVVVAFGGDGVEVDAELGGAERRDAGRRHGALRPNDAHVARGEGAGQDRHGEGHIEVVERRLHRAAR